MISTSGVKERDDNDQFVSYDKFQKQDKGFQNSGSFSKVVNNQSVVVAFVAVVVDDDGFS